MNESLEYTKIFTPAHSSLVPKYRRTFAWQKLWTLIAFLGLISALPLWAQAPNLLWRTNAAAKLFSADAQGNLYAATNGTIKVLSSAGQITQTKNICPIPGVVGRDSAGNYYFSGTFTNTIDFGGQSLTSEYSEIGHQPIPTCYLVKYDSSGTVIWGLTFHGAGDHNIVDDININTDDLIFVAWHYFGVLSIAELTKFSTSGTTLWETNLTSGEGIVHSLSLSALSGSNGCFIEYDDAQLHAGFYDASGNLQDFTTSVDPLVWHDPLSFNGKAFPGANGDGFVASYGYHENDTLGAAFIQRDQVDTNQAVSVLLMQPVGQADCWLVGTDVPGNLYVADANGGLSEYLRSGTIVWSNNFGSPVLNMMFDPSGNRYISMNDGTIGRLGADVVVGVTITSAPVGGTIFVGDSFDLSVGAAGYAPLLYQWLYQSNAQAAANPVPGGLGATLSLFNATAAESGLYSVVVSNVAGSATSAPVLLRVQSVAIFDGQQMLTNGTYHYPAPPTFTVKSAFANGQVYYTLDGSAPSFTSSLYTAPLEITNSATVKAIGYSSDFTQSAEADAVTVVVPPQFTLAVFTAGGGTIGLSSPTGAVTSASFAYGSNTLVTATATPLPGYVFLYWTGAATGPNPVANVVMSQNQSLTAVFGTTLSTSVAGDGQVLRSPAGNIVAYGVTVQLTALPAPGSFFGAWGNAASGSANPLYFTVTNPTPTISSVFGVTGPGQSALTVLTQGKGHVIQDPLGNVFATSQSVTLTATPDAGQTFVGWSGGASGTQNPLTVAMTQSLVITAQFTGQSVTLTTSGPGVNGMTALGFRFTVEGDPLTVYQIFSSTNLATWKLIGTVTNVTGAVPFTDSAAVGTPYMYYRARVAP